MTSDGQSQTLFATDTEQVVDRILAAVGPDLRVAVPLGLGKPLNLVNALYARAVANSDISVTFLTALSLEIPRESHPVRARLLQPVFDRLYAGCDEPAYARDLSRNALPSNVSVREFYLQAGSRLNSVHAQRNYISSNYTHAARDAFANGANVLAQLVAPGPGSGEQQRFSMSCNPDTMLELMAMIAAEGRPCISIGVVHPDLPYMYGDAEVPATTWDVLLDVRQSEPKLFPVPRLLPVSDVDYMIGVQASALVPDGGTLQIGIGALGDAIGHAIVLRQENNAEYQQLLADTAVMPRHATTIDAVGGTGRFDRGIYGATEMLTESFLKLLKHGVLRREVYDFWALQQLINDGRCNPAALAAPVLDGMDELGVRELRGKDFAVLQHHGFFTAQTRYHNGYITTAAGTRIPANLGDPETRRVLASEALGTALKDGTVLHGGFYLGSGQFYADLRALDDAQRRRINMCGVDKINQLDLNPRLFKAQRLNARFINTGLKVTVNGAVVSDTLEDGRVLSGVGGQYNFVAMAHHLQTGRSILMIRAVREQGGHAESNVVSSYGSCTIPRHLRDIIITEYGIADLRSKTDSEVAIALIEIADSRFQQQLLADARAVGKIPDSYEIPAHARNNTPAMVSNRLAAARARGLLPPYPGGCDFSDDELVLARALKRVAAIREAGVGQTLRALIAAPAVDQAPRELLERMQLTGDLPWRDRLLRRLLVAVLAE